jgi:hypothetical protein
MNATATATAVERTPVVEGYTAAQIEELRQRVLATGKVIAPVLTSLAGEMFHHGVSNSCIRAGVYKATGIALQKDVNECLQKWGIDPANVPTASDGRDAALIGDVEDIWRDALVDAFVDWTFSQEGE